MTRWVQREHQNEANGIFEKLGKQTLPTVGLGVAIDVVETPLLYDFGT